MGKSTCSLKTHRSQYQPESDSAMGRVGLLEPQFPQGRIASLPLHPPPVSGREDEMRGQYKAPQEQAANYRKLLGCTISSTSAHYYEFTSPWPSQRPKTIHWRLPYWYNAKNHAISKRLKTVH